jgi:hypothetical protein
VQDVIRTRLHHIQFLWMRASELLRKLQEGDALVAEVANPLGYDAGRGGLDCPPAPWLPGATGTRRRSGPAAPRPTGRTTYHGSFLASARRPERTTTPPPAQAVFSSPVILPGQILDSPELPSERFLEQFSKTVSAAEPPPTRNNNAVARQPLPKLTDALACARTAKSLRSSRSTRAPSPIPAPFHLAQLRKEGQVVHCPPSG